MQKLGKILLAFFTCCAFSYGQKQELKDVTVADLEQKEFPADPSAEAAMLYNSAKATADIEGKIELTIRGKVRIKIFNSEGYDWATKKIHYYRGETVRFSNACTYNLVNGAVVKTKLRSEGEISGRVNKYISFKAINLPDIKAGSIIEYEYVITTSDIVTLGEWHFQKSIPVVYSEYTASFPKEFIYSPNMRGYFVPKVINDSETRFMHHFKTTTFILKDLPALKDENFVNNMDNYTPQVAFELMDIDFPGYDTKRFKVTWEALVSDIFFSDDFNGELKKKNYFEKDLDALLTGLADPLEKTNAVLSFIKNKVKWNGEQGISCDEGVKNAYQAQAGNVAEINLMLTAALRHAGLEANPVLSSTRDNGISFSPTRKAFDNVLSSVKIGEEILFLDATEKFSAPGVLPMRDLNGGGYLIDEKGQFEIVKLSPSKPARENIMILAKLDAKGNISGQVRRVLQDNNALEHLEKYKDITEEKYLEELESENQHIIISEYKNENAADASKGTSETFSFQKELYAEQIGDKLYVSPALFMSETENPFKSEKREYPIDFGFPVNQKSTITLTIPEGMVVETLPEGITMEAEENIGTFKYAAIAKDNMIQVVQSMALKTPFVSAEFYPIIKMFFQSVIDKQKEKIILKKA